MIVSGWYDGHSSYGLRILEANVSLYFLDVLACLLFCLALALAGAHFGREHSLELELPAATPADAAGAAQGVRREVEAHGVTLLPVDSEHSAIFQALAGQRMEDVAKLILTCSGGPFRTWTAEAMADATVEQALAHPNWDMGDKISIDSATLMNKGLEVIEARWLFDVPPEQVGVVVHPQSIVHSFVEFVDGSAPGFAAVVGAAPDAETAFELMRRNPRIRLVLLDLDGTISMARPPRT